MKKQTENQSSLMKTEPRNTGNIREAGKMLGSDVSRLMMALNNNYYYKYCVPALGNPWYDLPFSRISRGSSLFCPSLKELPGWETNTSNHLQAPVLTTVTSVMHGWMVQCRLQAMIVNCMDPLPLDTSPSMSGTWRSCCSWNCGERLLPWKLKPPLGLSVH